MTRLRISEARGLNDTDITEDENSDGGWVRGTDTKGSAARIGDLIWLFVIEGVVEGPRLVRG